MDITTKRDKPIPVDAVIVGSGVSGLTAANYLSKFCNTIILEKEDKKGGLIRCEEVEGNLYHLVGGHVFNSKIPRIQDFFWGSLCNKSEFVSATRKASINIEGQHVRYPIENNLKQLGAKRAKTIVDELLYIITEAPKNINTFGDFLRSRFGQTLCDLYFFPYNQKIWCYDPDDMALDWLDGKLPMPSISEIISSNILNEEETGMVHSSFFYPRQKGSQHIVERLAEGLDIKTGHPLHSVSHLEQESFLLVNDEYLTKKLIYTGNIKELPMILPGGVFNEYQKQRILNLKSHGTSNVLCACEQTEYSWTYYPEMNLKAHRIINTGSFSSCNTSAELRSNGLSTCVVEFSGQLGESTARGEAAKLPGIVRTIAYNYCPNTYIIQDSGTREFIREIKNALEMYGIYLTGRFAEWEYYNMDTAMDAAITTAEYVLEAVTK